MLGPRTLRLPEWRPGIRLRLLLVSPRAEASRPHLAHLCRRPRSTGPHKSTSGTVCGTADQSLPSEIPGKGVLAPACASSIRAPALGFAIWYHDNSLPGATQHSTSAISARWQPQDRTDATSGRPDVQQPRHAATVQRFGTGPHRFGMPQAPSPRDRSVVPRRPSRRASGAACLRGTPSEDSEMRSGRAGYAAGVDASVRRASAELHVPV